MEPKLSDEAEAILVRLKMDVKDQLLTPEQFEFLRLALVLKESSGIAVRFLVGLGGVITFLLGVAAYLHLGESK